MIVRVWHISAAPVGTGIGGSEIIVSNSRVVGMWKLLIFLWWWAPTGLINTVSADEQTTFELGSARVVPRVAPSVATVTAKPVAPSSARPLQTFRNLDEETELLLKEVLNLGSDISILEQEKNSPSKYQLLILVSMESTKLFDLGYIELKVDEQIEAAHQYSTLDNQALMKGGSHRLYQANFPAGLHKLSVHMMGRVPRDPNYKSEVNFNFISGVSRTVLELDVNSKANNGFPALTVREWN